MNCKLKRSQNYDFHEKSKHHTGIYKPEHHLHDMGCDFSAVLSSPILVTVVQEGQYWLNNVQKRPTRMIRSPENMTNEERLKYGGYLV